MRLRGRFTLWFSLAALVPIALAALITRDIISRSERDNYERKRTATEHMLHREVTRLEQKVIDSVSALADRDPPHPLVDGLFVELEKNGGTLGPLARRHLRENGGSYMSGLGLDVLFLIDDSDIILEAPHYRPANDDVDPAPGKRVRGPFYINEPLIEEGTIHQVLVVESARKVTRGRYALTVVGGQRIDADLLAPIRDAEDIDARIVDRAGTVLVPPLAPWPGGDSKDDPDGRDSHDSHDSRDSHDSHDSHDSRDSHDSGATIRHPLRGHDGVPIATIEVILTDTKLEQVLAGITIAALLLAGAALLVTILLGWLIARRMTRNLDRLVEGTQAASSGDLDHRVDIKSRDEIGAVAESFNVMMVDLRESKERLVRAERIAAWQEIARRLAHEIKNPLTPIQMSMETLRKTYAKQHPSFEEIFEESTSTVLEESARLKRIVSEFSEFARMPKPSVSPCDLNDIVSSQLALYEGAIAIERDLTPGLPLIEADRGQIVQVLLNLLENARDALADRSARESGPARAADSDDSDATTNNDDADADDADDDAGQIKVATRLHPWGDRVELVIEDNGPGMPDHVKEKLFTPYFTTKQGKGGTGLGLAIVHRTISDHGGRVVVEDGDDGGARFTVQLPIAAGVILSQSFSP